MKWANTAMTITLKDNAGLLVPPSVQRRAGLKLGDRLKFQVSAGVITITAAPGKPAKRNTQKEPEYTPAQRRTIDARLDRAAKEVKAGLVSPAFDSIEDFAVALKSDAAKLKAKDKRSYR